MDHFAEVEEYFDGDTAMLAAIGGRNLQKAQTNHMGDFNAILDFPPAPKLDVLNRLIPSQATAQELRGEALPWTELLQSYVVPAALTLIALSAVGRLFARESLLVGR